MSGSRRAVGARVLAFALAAVVAAPPGAHAAGTVVIKGRGWGHGLGMSQYGAYGRALHGYGAKRILTHYYSGARVRRARLPARVRVGLLQAKRRVRIASAPGAGRGRVIFKVAGAGRIARGGPRVTWSVVPSRTGGMRLYRNGRKVKRNGRTVFGSPARPLVLVYARLGARVRLPQKSLSYAYGRMLLATYSPAPCGLPFCLRVVLALPMQKYLYGLGEVPASWPQAALRAQAIAARTYAYRRIRVSGQHRAPCDCALYDSSLDQVYSGDARRTSSGRYWSAWKRAVKRTRRRVVFYRGKPIQALYSSSSGGHTENNENVWGGPPIPYLRGVRDKADGVAANPNFRWRVRMDLGAFRSRLDSAYRIGKLKKVRLVRPFGVSGRVTVVKSARRGGVRLVGARAAARVSGWSLRSVLGLNDTWFRIRIRYAVARALGRAYGRAADELGRPLGEQEQVAGGRGLMQRFEGGTIYRLRSTGDAVALSGPLDARYRRIGGPDSVCGFPQAATSDGGATSAATFEHGTIAVSDDKTAVECAT